MILDGLICSYYSFDHWQVATTKTTGMSAFRQALKPLHTLPISLTTLTACPCRHTHHTAARTPRRREVFTFSLGTPNTVNADATFEKTQKQTKYQITQYLLRQNLNLLMLLLPGQTSLKTNLLTMRSQICTLVTTTLAIHRLQILNVQSMMQISMTRKTNF